MNVITEERIKIIFWQVWHLLMARYIKNKRCQIYIVIHQITIQLNLDVTRLGMIKFEI